jgi:hypothetical protein
MKKNLAVIAAYVIMTAAFFGCAYQAFDEDAPKYDELGRRLVEFSIPTGNMGGGVIRSLDGDMAKAAYDYVEVMYRLDNDGYEYYAGSAIKGQDIHFALPVGNYDAVMFAGAADGMRLLATGVATKVNDDETDGDGTLEIKEDTSTIEFTLHALVADIYPWGGDSSFKVENPGASPITYPSGDYLLRGENVPFFQIPAGVAYPSNGEDPRIKGTFTIKGLKRDGVGVPDGSLFAAETLFGVPYVNSIEMKSIGVSAYNLATNISLIPVEVKGRIDGINIDDEDLVIELLLDTSEVDKAGLSKVRFDIPVQAFTAYPNAAAPSGKQGNLWHISNGLEAGAMDTGGKSIGQNILLAVGVNPGGQTVIVDDTDIIPPPAVGL